MCGFVQVRGGYEEYVVARAPASRDAWSVRVRTRGCLVRHLCTFPPKRLQTVASGRVLCRPRRIDFGSQPSTAGARAGSLPSLLGEFMTLSIETATTDTGVVTVELAGEVDYATAPQIRETITNALEAGGVSSIRVDVAKVTVLDSTGIGTIVVAYRIAREMGVELAVVGPNRFITRLFTVVGAEELLEEPTETFSAKERSGAP
ncbi:STAS domain-containing protein [Glycomyces buryatensis]|uniref:Anti-sigma factor antagonist n=2 Tax=Glycomyces buryatensis TaxID=2570927 RepID=A0A4S8PVZ6_9ACTN|nr:STAS domain-containing protein [Glycomyces buryatensis]